MEYIKENIEKMLIEHNRNESKLIEIELKIAEYTKRLEYAGTVYQDNDKEAIEGMQLKGQVISDIPKSATNNVSDPTYNTVVNYNKEKIHINKEDRNLLERKIERLEDEKDLLNKAIVRVENMMNPLSIEEKFVIKVYYMDKCKWDYVEKEYFREFEKYKSTKRLQAYRDNAIDTMLKIVNVGS